MSFNQQREKNRYMKKMPLTCLGEFPIYANISLTAEKSQGR